MKNCHFKNFLKVITLLLVTFPFSIYNHNLKITKKEGEIRVDSKIEYNLLSIKQGSRPVGNIPVKKIYNKSSVVKKNEV